MSEKELSSRQVKTARYIASLKKQAELMAKDVLQQNIFMLEEEKKQNTLKYKILLEVAKNKGF